MSVEHCARLIFTFISCCTFFDENGSWNEKQARNAVSRFEGKCNAFLPFFPLKKRQHTANRTTKDFIFAMKSINSTRGKRRKKSADWQTYEQRNFYKRPENYFEGWKLMEPKTRLLIFKKGRQKKIHCNCNLCPGSFLASGCKYTFSSNPNIESVSR